MTKRTLLGGRYSLGETLGVGGMAQVYAGRDSRLGRDVAVKILRAELVGDPTFIARFRREAQAAASLNHPNVVSVYDTGEQDGVPYIVMERVEGLTLREVLRTEGPMLPQRALEVGADVCLALQYSHEAGIVHRDIKPANVMLTPTGTVKVMDFGIARAVSSQTMTQTADVVGTAAYLSPEQARGEHVDARSDVYSLGCLLYELLTRTPPFSGESPVAVAYQHVREDADLPSERNPELTDAVDAVVMKAMAKNPGNRYQSAAEFRDDLLRAAAGRVVAATPILDDDEASTLLVPAALTQTLPAATPRLTSRGRAVAYTGLLVTSLVLALGAWLLVRSLVGGDGTTVRVPSVIKAQLEDARKTLAAKGLRVGTVTPVFVEPAERAEFPTGSVVSQDPLAPFEVTKGSTVDLKVSSGVRRVRLPDLVGTLRDKAEEELAELDLIAKIVPVDRDARPGEVLVMSPAPGTELEVGAVVTLTVVSGQLNVPDVVGLDEDAAFDQLRTAGFKVTVKREPSMQPAGTVLATDPAPGARVDRGATITIVVADEPSPTPEPEPTPDPEPTDEPTATPTPEPTPT